MDHLKGLGLVAGLGLTTLICSSSPALAQSLSAASSFAVEGAAGVTAGGAGTVIGGSVGSSPNASISGFPSALVVPPFGIHANDAAAIAAQAADSALFLNLFGGACLVGPGYAAIDLSISRSFPVGPKERIELRVEAFNLLNRTNYTLVGRILNSATFGQLLSQAAPRHWQVGARFTF